MADRYLILEDGRATTFGEVVFNTVMTGYQQVITNQIYHNQIIVFSQPTIGAVGIDRSSYESVDPTCKGVIVRDVADVSINRRRRLSLDEYLKLAAIKSTRLQRYGFNLFSNCRYYF